MTRYEIIQLCEKYSIVDYTINNDLSIDVNRTVHIDNWELTELPLHFGIVNGHFDCSNNYLTTLKGSPKTVTGIFMSQYNNLKTIAYAPNTAKVYWFNNNPLENEIINNPHSYIKKYNREITIEEILK